MTSIPAPVVSLANAALSGVMALSSPAGWREGTRRAFVWAPGAAVTGWMLWVSRRVRKAAAARQEEDPAAPAPVEALVHPSAAADERTAAQPGSPDSTADAGPGKSPLTQWGLGLAVSLAAGSIASAFMWISLRADAGLEAWLRRCGVRRPRRWMAVGTALTSLALDAAMNARESKGAEPESGRPA